jgi:hypothetical protein
VDAIGCAVAMQQAVHRHNERQADQPSASPSSKRCPAQSGATALCTR